MIPLLKMRLSYIKRKPFKNFFTFALPIILSLLLSYLANEIIKNDSKLEQEPQPTIYSNLNYSFNFINYTFPFPSNDSLAIISKNEKLKEIMIQKYNQYFLGHHNIKNYSNYSEFLNYINSIDYNNTNFTFSTAIDIINEENETMYKFKNKLFSFESVISRENKLNFPSGKFNLNYFRIYNSYFLLSSLVEQEIGNKPKLNLIISPQILTRRPLYNPYSEDSSTSILISGLLTFCYCLIFFSFFDWMIEEKEKKLNYFLYRQGVSKKIYYFSWFIFFLLFAFFTSLFTSFVISRYILYNGIYLYTFFANLFFIFNIFGLCFFFTSFIEKVESGQKITKFIYIGSTMMGLMLLETGISKILRIIFAFLPNINLMISISILLLLDNFKNVDITLLTTKHNQISLFDSFIISLCSFFFYIIFGILIIAYNEGVLKYYFCNNESNEEETGNKVAIDSDVDKSLTQFEIHHENLTERNLNLLFEKNCLSIKNVYKIYADLKAVNNFNGDIFPDEIFCLLGHNGAGKTTLIKMISGLENLDNGDITLDGISLVQNKDYLYENIGLCTQDDLFFDDLTIEEHLIYMSEIKGKKANLNEINNLINKLDLDEKKYDLAKNLSGGQKRKLCIALALIGNSKLVLLDEPTSGMDVIAKKQLWKFLEGYKKDRIIILTTHSLDEAEYLGDRIGIMNEGRFICSGTSSYLKSNYPCGFNINFLINSKISNKESRRDLFNQLKNIDDSAEIKLESKGVFTINFSKMNNNVKDIFDLIDLKKDECGIENYTVSTTSLEDVFLKLNDSNYTRDTINQNNDINIINVEDNENKLIIEKERASFFKQICNNLKKNLITLWRGKIRFLLEILGSSIMVIIYLSLYQLIQQNDKTKEQDLNYLLSKTTIYYTTIDCDISFLQNSSFAKNKSLTFEEVKLNNSLLEKLDPEEINKEFYNNKMEYHYEKIYLILKKNESGYYSIIFNQVGEYEFYLAATNLIFSSFYENTTGIKISAFNEISTIPDGIKTKNNVNNFDFIMKLFSVAMIWYSFISFLINMLQVPIRDRINNVKHLLYLSGENMIAYWIGFVIVDLIKFLFYSILLLLILIWFDDVYLYYFIFEIPFFFALIIITYCFTYIFDNEGTAHTFYNIIILFGSYILIGLSAYIYGSEFLDFFQTENFKFNFIHDLIPSSTFYFALLNMMIASILPEPMKTKLYKSTIKNKSLVFLIQIIFYLIILFLLEIRIIQRIGNTILFYLSFKNEDIEKETTEQNEKILNNKSGNEYINIEKEKINTSQNLTTKIVNLSKTFFNCCSKNNRAVRNLYLGLESNEKFGLLGFNGSGKSTTFKSITNQIFYDMGEISLFNLDNQKDFGILRKNIGYCPQENPLFDYLNVTQAINYYRELKGVNEKTENIIERFGLKSYKKTICKNLSGGNKRKLTFSIALMGNPKIILLDEPSSAVDPESRRGMWKNINLLSKKGNEYNMILTTHSMEEAEVLCDTVSWFKQGNFMCVGNPEKLKIKFSVGYLLHVKFGNSDNNNFDICNGLEIQDLNGKIVIKNDLAEKMKDMNKINYYLGKLINVVDFIRENTFKIELKDVGKDYSFELEIGINKEKQGEIFTQILTMKNTNPDVSEISINTDSLENILTQFN